MAVVAPSGPVVAERLAAGREILESWGLRVEVAPHVLDTHPRLGYLAGSDHDRAADLQRAWLDPSISAVLCARGGYGAQRMIDLLDWPAMRGVPPKVFAGFSDITALHEAFAEELGIVTLHAPMVASSAFIEDGVTADGLRRALFEPERATVLSAPSARPVASGRAIGVTIGGCLALLADGRGAASTRPSAAGTLLMLEDVGEETYQLDRMLTSLSRSGWLAGVAGIALGSWHECTPDLEAVRLVMEDRLGDLGVPVLWELGFGHGPRSLTVPLGLPAELDADAGTVTYAMPPLV
ncbi:LD-carboxypeptidase [Spiractinospora alimapuensis]|nr:LD-carboxypeptidase [Spiractinospora alimapuensis]